MALIHSSFSPFGKGSHPHITHPVSEQIEYLLHHLSGRRIVYQLVREKDRMVLIVIGAREDDAVYDIAHIDITGGEDGYAASRPFREHP